MISRADAPHVISDLCDEIEAASITFERLESKNRKKAKQVSFVGFGALVNLSVNVRQAQDSHWVDPLAPCVGGQSTLAPTADLRAAVRLSSDIDVWRDLSLRDAANKVIHQVAISYTLNPHTLIVAGIGIGNNPPYIARFTIKDFVQGCRQLNWIA